MDLIAARISNADLPVGCSVDLPVHAVRYTKMRIALSGAKNLGASAGLLLRRRRDKEINFVPGSRSHQFFNGRHGLDAASGA